MLCDSLDGRGVGNQAASRAALRAKAPGWESIPCLFELGGCILAPGNISPFSASDFTLSSRSALLKSGLLLNLPLDEGS